MTPAPMPGNSWPRAERVPVERATNAGGTRRMNADDYRELRRRVTGLNGQVNQARKQAPPPEDLSPAQLERLADALQAVREGRAAHEAEREVHHKQSQARAKARQEGQRLRTLKTNGSVTLA